MQLTAANYYSAEANRDYLSNSEFADWTDCPRRKAAVLRGEWQDEETTAMLVGKYVDAALLEPDTLTDLVESNRDAIVNKKGELRADFVRAEAMIARAKKDEAFMSALTGQSQLIATWEMFGVKWKARFDCVDRERGMLTDLKTCRDFEPTWDNERKMRIPFYERWNYWRQMAIYREGYRATFGAYPDYVFIAAVTKQESPRVKVLLFDGTRANDGADRFERELENVQDRLPEVLAHRQAAQDGKPLSEFRACKACDYCAATLPCAIEYAESLVW